MPLTNFPYGVSSFGIPVIGAGPILTTGRIVFVDSSTGSNNTARGSYEKPLATLAYAFSADMVRANKGDVIILMPGHSEAVIANQTILADIAGVRVVGLGQGSSRPTINFTTATTATLTITAANVSLENLIFTYIAFDATATGIVISGADCCIRGCRFDMSDASEQAAVAVSLAAGADRFQFLDNQVEAEDAGATACINSAVALDRVRIERNFFAGNFSTAAVNNATLAWTRCLIANNMFYVLGTGNAITMVATSTGIIVGNHIQITANIAAGGSITAAAALKSENYAQETAGIAASAVVDPAAVAIT